MYINYFTLVSVTVQSTITLVCFTPIKVQRKSTLVYFTLVTVQNKVHKLF